MNRAILLLNLTVLVVSFVLALSSSNSQIGILRSAEAAANPSWSPRRGPRDDSGAALGYLRVVQSLETIVPPQERERLSGSQMLAIRNAMERYRAAVSTGVVDGLATESKGAELLATYAAIGKAARGEVENELATYFDDRNLVFRLTAEIIRNCR